MQLDDIKASVRPGMREKIDGLFDRFRDELGSGDLDRFVSWLHDGGHISAQTFRGLHAGGALVLTSVETLSESTYYPDERDSEELLDAIEQIAPEPEVDGSQRFQMLGKLAAGAMGEILIVRDRELQRKVALKRMHASIARKPKLSRRFLNEAQITAQLDHPNIVPVYSLDSGKNKPLSYTMKLIRGNTFAQLIFETQRCYDENRPIDEEHDLPTRLDHFVRACDALAYAHSRGVVHRDLKPENIMVGAYGEVYVMDWGIARIMGSPEESHDEMVELGSGSVTRTRFGAVLGTPAYMSPEQAVGLNDALDGRSDGFSLGLILYELVSLRPAVSGSDANEILERMQEGRLDPIRHHSDREVIAPELQAIIAKATARHPDHRYQTVKELAEDVRRFQRGEEVRAMPDGLVQRGLRWLWQNRELVVFIVAFFVLFLGALTLGSLGSTVVVMQNSRVQELQVAELLSQVSRRAHTIDSRFQGYQALLKVLASSALEANSRPDGGLDPSASFYAPGSAFGSLDTLPGLLESDVYGRAVSLDLPTTSVAPGVDPLEVGAGTRRLALLRGPLRRALIDAHDEAAATTPADELRARLLGEPGPIRWIFVGLESGVGVTYPGHLGVPPGHDHRKEPWYDAARDKRGAVWGNPHLDDAGLDTLLPVSQAIWDDDGQQLGVVALEVGLSYIQEKLLSIPGFEQSEAFVLDEQGLILMSTRQEEDRSSQSALRTRWLRRKRFEVEAVSDAVAERSGGTFELKGRADDKDLAVWSRMGDIGWTYLVWGPRSELMR